MNKKIQTGLKYFDDRVFPEGLDCLNESYNPEKIDCIAFQVIGQSIDGYIGINRPETNDEDKGFWSLKFNAGEGKLAVLFPITKNNSEDELRERSISIYTKGEVDIQSVETIVKKLHYKLLSREV